MARLRACAPESVRPWGHSARVGVEEESSEPTEQEPAGGRAGLRWQTEPGGVPGATGRAGGADCGRILLADLSRLPGAFPARPGLTPVTF